MHSLSSDNGAHSADLFRRMETCMSKSKSACCLSRELTSPGLCLCGTWIIFGFPCGLIMHNHPLKPICSLKTHLSVKPVALKPCKVHSYGSLHHMCSGGQIPAKSYRTKRHNMHSRLPSEQNKALLISQLPLWKLSLKKKNLKLYPLIKPTPSVEAKMVR